MLLKVEKPGDRINEVEDEIKDIASDGWEVAGYSATLARGIRVPTYSHLVLFKRRLSDAGRNVRRGTRLADKKQYREAIAEFDKAIELDPELGTAFAARGFAYAELAEVDRAAADIRKALSLIRDPKLIAHIEEVFEAKRRANEQQDAGGGL